MQFASKRPGNAVLTVFGGTLGLLLAMPAAVRAGDLNAQVQAVVAPEGTGFLFNYTVTNLSSSVVNLGVFDLVVSPTANLHDIVMPAGYLNDYTPGNAEIEFLSTDASVDIKPGFSDVFYFTADVGPTTGIYSTRSFDEFDPPATSAGTTLTPTAVTPEPASLGLLAVGSMALLRRRRRATRSVVA